MNISAPLINYNVSAQATASRGGSGSAITLLQSTATNVPSDANQAYVVYALLTGIGTSATINLSTGTTNGNAWTTPVRQIETATAAGTITTAGDASVTITTDGGLPKQILFPVALNDTASDWAEKCRQAIIDDSLGQTVYDVSGTGTSIVLTRKPYATYTIGDTVIEMAEANDTTCNIALDNSTCAGITAAPTSANTQAGNAGGGRYIGNNGVDYEGISLDSPSDIYAVLIEHSTDDANDQQLDYTIGTEYKGRLFSTRTQSSSVLLSYPDTTSILDSLAVVGASDSGLVKVTVIAKV